MSVAILKTILNAAAHESSALTRFVSSAEHLDGLANAVRNKNVTNYLDDLETTYHMTHSAEDLASIRSLKSDPQFLSITSRLSSGGRLAKLDAVGERLGRIGKLSDDAAGAEVNNISRDLNKIMGYGKNSPEAARIADSVEDVAASARAVHVTNDAHQSQRAALRAAAEAAEVAARADSRSKTTRNTLIAGTVLGTGGVFSSHVLAQIDKISGAGLSTEAADIVFDKVEEQIEAGVDVEEALQTLGTVYDGVHYVIDPLDQSREEASMQLIRRTNIPDGVAPTAEQIRQMHTSAVLANLTDAPDFAVHAGLIGYEVDTLVKHGQIAEADANAEYVNRFSGFIAENMDYVAFEDYPITPDIVEDIIRTDSSVGGRIVSGMPETFAGIFASQIPELAERHPELTKYVEAEPSSIMADSRDVVRDATASGKDSLAILRGDPLGILGSAASELKGDFFDAVGQGDKLMNAAFGMAGIENEATQNFIKAIAAFLVVGKLGNIIGDRTGLDSSNGGMKGLAGIGLEFATLGAMFSAAYMVMQGKSSEEVFDSAVSNFSDWGGKAINFGKEWVGNDGEEGVQSSGASFAEDIERSSEGMVRTSPEAIQSLEALLTSPEINDLVVNVTGENDMLQELESMIEIGDVEHAGITVHSKLANMRDEVASRTPTEEFKFLLESIDVEVSRVGAAMEAAGYSIPQAVTTTASPVQAPANVVPDEDIDFEAVGGSSAGLVMSTRS